MRTAELRGAGEAHFVVSLRAAALNWSAVVSISVVILEKAIVLKDKLVTLFPHPDNKEI